MPPEFSLTTESLDEQRHVVAVAGDLTNTTFLDSTALGVLIGAVKRLRSRDGVLTIVNTDPNIAKTFEITGLDQIFTIRPTRDEAVEALDADEAAA
jgi:anti-sigma B factor antagonist